MLGIYWESRGIQSQRMSVVLSVRRVAVEAGGFCGRQAPTITEAVISNSPLATWIHRLRVRFQSFLRVRSQMSFFGWARFVWRSFRPRPWVVPTRIQPDAL